MYYANIKYYDIANGVGIRTSLFVSGCRRHCKNCFNQETWSFSFGEPFTRAVEEKIYRSLDSDYVDGLTVLGGEPMEPENQRELLPFFKRFNERFPEKTIWLYSGYTWEEMTKGPARCEVTDSLLRQIDLLVDGPFVQEQYDVSLRFRGSANQRILDVPASLAAGYPVMWEDDRVYSARYNQ